jgi:hypothetical protein
MDLVSDFEEMWTSLGIDWISKFSIWARGFFVLLERLVSSSLQGDFEAKLLTVLKWMAAFRLNSRFWMFCSLFFSFIFVTQSSSAILFPTLLEIYPFIVKIYFSASNTLFSILLILLGSLTKEIEESNLVIIVSLISWFFL